VISTASRTAPATTLAAFSLTGLGKENTSRTEFERRSLISSPDSRVTRPVRGTEYQPELERVYNTKSIFFME